MVFRTVGSGEKTRHYVDRKQVTKEEYNVAMAAEKALLPKVTAYCDCGHSQEDHRGHAHAAGTPEPSFCCRCECQGFTHSPALIVWKPIVSRALSVHPKQVEEANARAKRHGLGIEYRPDGKPILTSRENRKKLLRLEGFHDNDGGYGD